MSFMITMADNVMTGFNKFNQYSLSLQLLRLCLTDFGIFVVYLATNFLCLTVLSGYKSILLHELFAKLHDANITQPRFLSISIGYRCVAESTTRLPSSVIKHSNCNNLRILYWSILVIQTVACFEVIYVRPTVNTVFVDKHCCAPTVWNSLPSFVRIADSFTSFRSQLKTYMFARHL